MRGLGSARPAHGYEGVSAPGRPGGVLDHCERRSKRCWKPAVAASGHWAQTHVTPPPTRATDDISRKRGRKVQSSRVAIVVGRRNVVAPSVSTRTSTRSNIEFDGRACSSVCLGCPPRRAPQRSGVPAAHMLIRGMQIDAKVPSNEAFSVGTGHMPHRQCRFRCGTLPVCIAT